MGKERLHGKTSSPNNRLRWTGWCQERLAGTGLNFDFGMMLNGWLYKGMKCFFAFMRIFCTLFGVGDGNP